MLRYSCTYTKEFAPDLKPRVADQIQEEHTPVRCDLGLPDA